MLMQKKTLIGALKQIKAQSYKGPLCTLVSNKLMVKRAHQYKVSDVQNKHTVIRKKPRRIVENWALTETEGKMCSTNPKLLLKCAAGYAVSPFCYFS